MPFVRPTSDELIDRIVADLGSSLNLSGPALRRSVIGILARVEAGAAHELHGHLDFIAKQILPDTAESDFLVRHASLYLDPARLPAAFAAGAIVVTGTNGTVIPQGTTLQRADGVTFSTDADGTIALGSATIDVTADNAGVSGNTDEDIELTFASPVAGADSIATVDEYGLVGGADVETDDELRVRLIGRLRQPPHGGSSGDYEMWSKEVSGVTRVWIFEEGLGAGTVLVYFVRDNDGDGAAIIPDAGEIADVQAYLDARRPVTAAVTVVAPTADAMAVTVSITPDNASTRAAVEAELADLLARDAEPGGTIKLSQILLSIGVADGVTDFDLTSPVADVTHAAGHMAIPGTVTFV